MKLNKTKLSSLFGGVNSEIFASVLLSGKELIYDCRDSHLGFPLTSAQHPG